jgi:hypothetical protein
VTVRRVLTIVAGLMALLLGLEALLWLAGTAGRPVVVDVGPSTGAYGSGFTESEERPPSTFRWTRAAAALELPLLVRGDAPRVVMRAARFVDHPTRIHVSLAGARAGSFTARPGGHRVYALDAGAVDGPLRVDLLSEDPELGVALDWVRVEGVHARTAPGDPAPLLLVAAVFLIALGLGLPLPRAMAVAGGLSVVLAAWAAADPFAFVHVVHRVARPGAVPPAGAAAGLRGVRGGRVATFVFLAAYLLKAAALFHPSYFYNDVRNNLRYVQALRDDGRPLLERNRTAQVQVGVAYPRIVGGRKYAFPYSPVFFLPFTGLPDDRVVEAIKHVALAATAAEVVLVLLLSRLVFGDRGGLFAAVLAALLPPLHSRLLLAMWSTVTGHVLDLGAIVCAAAIAARPAWGPGWPAYLATTTAALLTYVSSLFNLTLFSAAWAALERRRALRIAAVWGAAVALTLGLLYRGFVVEAVREILPAAVAGGGGGGERMGLGESVLGALARIPLFYGYGLPALAAAGLVLARRRAEPAVFRVVGAAVLAFAGLVALRAVSLGLFKDLKEVEFASPLIALLAGASLDALWERGPSGRVAAILVLGGVAAFALVRYGEYVSTYTFLAGVP